MVRLINMGYVLMEWEATLAEEIAADHWYAEFHQVKNIAIMGLKTKIEKFFCRS